MNLQTWTNNFVADDRLIANLVAVHLIIAGLLIVGIVLRKILTQGGEQFARWTGLHWLDGFSKEATRRLRTILFWIILALMAGTVLAGLGYQAGGRDMRQDVTDWYTHLTGAQILHMGLALGELVLLGLMIPLAVGLVRRLKSPLEARAASLLPHVPDLENSGSNHPARQADSIKHWFNLLERLVLVSIFLSAAWVTGHILGLGQAVDPVVMFTFRLVAILMVARLMTLACRTVSHTLASLGNRHLGNGQFSRYWERVTRLFPFGERCFEAAVYVSAASLILRELEFIAVVADIGPRIVQCIGIFFGTRVVIELLQVLLNEGFGLYDENRAVDQKVETLLPLLQSISQYLLFFGSGVIMLGVLGVDTRPILAGAGILGLAGGLGAQSLVTDLVSGFFILFENQYLVGDMVQIGDAVGRVEAVSIRLTQIRDEHGKLYIIPNGQVKNVINYSKGYVNAVVDIKVPTSTNLDQVMKDMADAGKRLKQTRREVLGETVVKGLIELTPADMTIRAVTKVQPGTHIAMQSEYRKHLKEIFDLWQRSKTTSIAA